MKRIFLAIILCLPFIALAQKASISVVPYPSKVETTSNKFFTLPNNYRVSAPKSLSAISNVMIGDIKLLLNKRGVKSANSNADIEFKLDKSFEKEAYKLTITPKKVVIAASTKEGISYGVTSFLQLLDEKSGKAACVAIEDKPAFWYRALMLDVARQWVEVQTIKQTIDLCRWYKIPYLQLHISDDQSFTFPSKAFPNLASKDRQYTRAELKYLVEYAKERGVIIIPELDLPGHCSAMRNSMPELFGKGEWGVIDMVNEECFAAVKTLMREVMDVFYTSEYFHMGGDEAWFGNYEKLPHVKKAIKERGFDGVHDLYLEFLVKMHNFIKKEGKKSLIWESFQGKGSRKVQIPTDITVMAWETLYQAPQSLIDNGYNIISAPWKPFYVCPGFRWSPEYIYNHNARRFENHWNITPAFISPIQLTSNNHIEGGQMCAWEMDDPSFITSLHTRIPALSEVLWNDSNKRVFSDYEQRVNSTDSKYRKMIFPVVDNSYGFKSIDKYKLDDSRVEHFVNKGIVKLMPITKGDYITYTTDKSMPTSKSARLKDSLVLDNDAFIKFALFNSRGKIKGYRSSHYERRPIDAINLGDMVPVRDRNIGMARRKEIFNNKVTVILNNGAENSELYYTLDNSKPTTNSIKYVAPIELDKTTMVKAQSFVDGKAVGTEFNCNYIKRDFEKTLSTNKPVYIDEINKTGKITNYIVDGEVDIDYYWGNERPTAVIVDLESVEIISAARLYTFWDNNRYYQYTIEVSKDGKNWNKVADYSSNTVKATKDGFIHIFEPIEGRYIKVNMLRNSANHAMHIVELKVY